MSRERKGRREDGVGRKGALEADLHWPGSEVWYEENLSAMLRCVDLSRALVDAHGPARNSLMQLKVTALASTRLCVSDK